ncbi:MAG: FixH family protein [Caldilineales bacterium]|nr:FixH family protein [Caldilineales bacterium]MDW8317310.1 FixH family protein [Anaerolineae bacterium]
MLVLSSATACQRGSAQPEAADQAPDVAMTFAVSPDPPAVGWSTAVVTLADAHGQPIEAARVRLRGDMNHPGMQPVLAEAADAGGGQYAAQLGWTMAGDWFVIVTAELPDGRQAVRRFDLRVRTP